jgi:hypothetical protein
MPHYAGRDENGYSHNWWDYLLNMNHVTGLAADEQYGKGKVVLAGGDTLEDVSFRIKYHTGEKKTATIGESGATVTYQDGGIFAKVDGRVVPSAVGAEKITIMYDGHALEYTVEVTEVAEEDNQPKDTNEPVEEENTEKEEPSEEAVIKEEVSEEKPAEEADADVTTQDVKEENTDEEENEDMAFVQKVIEVVKGLPMAVILAGVVVCIGFVVVLVVIMKREKK